MKISIVRLVRYAVFPLMLGAVICVSQSLRAQPVEDRDITRLNRTLKGRVSSPTFDGIVWSNVNIYQVGGEYLQRITKLISGQDTNAIAEVNKIGLTLFDEPHPDLYGLISRVGSRAQWDPNKKFTEFRKQIAKEVQMDDFEDIDEEELRRAANITLTVKQARDNRPKNFYLVTSRDLERPRLIALLGVKGTEAKGDLTVAGDNYVWAGTELYDQLRSNGADVTLYDDIKSEVKDRTGRALANRTYALRSFDSIDLAPRTHARATYLDEKQYAYVLTSISEGRPLRDEPKVEDTTGGGGGGFNLGSNFGDLGGSKGVLAGAVVPGTGEYPYELTLGTDVIASFRSYDIRNKKEPILQWGVELRNNFDEINYPSIWGGRLTLSAMLENIKLGAVMPHIRFGDSTIGTSGFGTSRQHIIGGWGAAISGDFDAPVLDNSGLFNFYASYTFSESNTDNLARSTSRVVSGKFVEIDDTLGAAGDVASLIRFAAQGYYSFGFYLDDYAKHMVRLKIGGTVYGVDFFRRAEDPDIFVLQDTANPAPFILRKVGSTDIHGGVSGKIEYMKGGTKYPFGASLQYIDQSILANAWIQFVVSQRIDLKFDLKFFTPVFRDPRAWENPKLTVPSLTFKYHFGTPPADPNAPKF